MTTLTELQERMNGASDDDALRAARELANFYFIFNEEYNALQDKLIEADAAYVQATQGGQGVDQALALRLQACMLELKARMATLDMHMRAFHNGSSITPPSAENIAKVKELSKKLAGLIVSDQALDTITGALTDIGNVVKGSTG